MFRARLLSDGKEAAAGMGFEMPEHHRHLVVLENTAQVHNLIVCTQCSCTAYSIIGARGLVQGIWNTAPVWCARPAPC